VNKQAISLVEVLVAVMLISVVVVSLLQIKENNLHFLEKSKDTIKYNAYISMVTLDNNKDGNIYLDSKIDFKDDDIRKELKKIKIVAKNEELSPTIFNIDDYSLQININKVTLSIDDKIKKQFFNFTLN
jgi:hypothetical protein